MVSELVAAITETVTGLLGGIGAGIVGLFDDLFMNATSDGLSTLGTFTVVLLGISIALGAVAWVSTLIRNKR